VLNGIGTELFDTGDVGEEPVLRGIGTELLTPVE